MVKAEILFNIDHMVYVPLKNWFDNFHIYLEQVKSLIKSDQQYIIMTNTFSDTYNNLWFEPDYYLLPWKQWFGNNKKGKVPYMSQTLHIWKENIFYNITLNDRVYIILNKIRTHEKLYQITTFDTTLY